MRAEELELQLKIEESKRKQIESQATISQSSGQAENGSNLTSRPATNLKLLPFVEGKDNMDAYLTRFQRYITIYYLE